MKGIVGIFIGSTVMLFSSIGQAQVSTNPPAFPLLSAGNSATNEVPANQPAEPPPATSRSPVIPLVQMRGVPIGTAIASLAREAGINYIIDQRVVQAWINSKEPSVTLKLENVAAKDVLQRILDVHHLALVENPVTRIARVTSNDQTVDDENTGLLSSLLANKPAAGTNEIVPLIQLSDVPLDTALEHLTRGSGFRFDYPVRLQNSDGTPWFNRQPSLSVRWENITCIQAVFALCENYDLTVTRDDATGTLGIEPKRFKTHHHLQLR